MLNWSGAVDRDEHMARELCRVDYRREDKRTQDQMVDIRWRDYLPMARRAWSVIDEKI